MAKINVHKISYAVPSNKRVEFEKMVEELFSQEEGFRHLGSFPFDPDNAKPIFRTVKAAPAQPVSSTPTLNGGAPVRMRQDTQGMVMDVLTRDRRPYSLVELSRRLGVTVPAAGGACKKLASLGKLKSLVRGVYELA